MSKLSDTVNKHVREMLGTYSIGKATPASATGATTFKTTQDPAGTLQMVIGGVPSAKLANLTTTAPLALAALQNPITGQDTFYVQPASTTVYYLIVVNAAGTVYVIQGTYSGQSFTPFKNSLGTGDLPDIAVAETYAPIGCFKVVTGTTAFTVGTTNLDATTGGMAITWASLNKLPNGNPATA